MPNPPDQGEASDHAAFDSGVNAVIPGDPPQVVVTTTAGRAGWNRDHNEIRVDPLVMQWPAQAQRFLGAHEAAHVGQTALPRWTTLVFLGVPVLCLAVSILPVILSGSTTQTWTFGAQWIVLTVAVTLLIISESRPGGAASSCTQTGQPRPR